MIKNYTPAIVKKYEEAGRIINYLMGVHKLDKKRIKKATDRDLQLSDELDALENGFSYGGSK